jgi:hypothetical protein
LETSPQEVSEQERGVVSTIPYLSTHCLLL